MTTTPSAGWNRGSTRYELSATARPRRVLLAEDDDVFRQLLATWLRRDNFEVTEARDGRELLCLVAARIQAGAPAFDLVISDIRMPVMTGFDALAGLRSAAWMTPVIFITAFGDDDARARARSLGARALFAKPFDLHDLRTMAMHIAGA